MNERLILGADRFAVGGYLLRLWGFSSKLVRAITSLADPLQDQSEPVTWALRAATAIVESGRVEELTAGIDDDVGDALKSMLEELALGFRVGTEPTALAKSAR